MQVPQSEGIQQALITTDPWNGRAISPRRDDCTAPTSGDSIFNDPAAPQWLKQHEHFRVLAPSSTAGGFSTVRQSLGIVVFANEEYQLFWFARPPSCRE